MTDIDLCSLSAYQYDLPRELIAKEPCVPRDHSRLLIVDRHKQNFYEIPFHQIQELLCCGDSMVFNNTKVIPARLIGSREAGEETEIFLLKQRSYDQWEVLARPGKKLKPGRKVTFGEEFSCEVLDTFSEGTKLVRFFWKGEFFTQLEKYGQLPLPHYIERSVTSTDSSWYQTVYAAKEGAVAAPTAGLHFTDQLLGNLRGRGVDLSYVTLHVGLGTFKPVQTDDIRQHQMHSESLIIDEPTASVLNSRSSSSRQICVGTTSCRVLESAADDEGVIHAGSFDTNIFIYPGYRFKYIQALLTNFHLPGSTLLMLVSAFGGYELMMEAYRKAVRDQFRFFSYGDAMLIL